MLNGNSHSIKTLHVHSEPFGSFSPHPAVVVFALFSIISAWHRTRRKIINQNNENVRRGKSTFVRATELVVVVSQGGERLWRSDVWKNDQSCARKNKFKWFCCCWQSLRVTRGRVKLQAVARKKIACSYKKQMTVCCLPSIVYYSSG